MSTSQTGRPGGSRAPPAPPTPSQPAAASIELEGSGERPVVACIAGYELGPLLGGGGGGTVYRATGPDGAVVALKVVDARVVDDATRERFAREASIRIEHPNIVRVLDAGTDPQGRPFLALELLEGDPLSAVLKRERLSASQARDTAVQVCRGLEVAHSAGVIHRDLKPENLFVCTDGTVKIVDFGIALITDEQARLTATGMVLGTPSYLSPEQAQGDRTLDQRTDLWSLGAVFYECLTGERPFERETALATVLAIASEELVPIVDKRLDTPEALAFAIEKCLVKDRDFRWQTATELRVALEAVDMTATGNDAATRRMKVPVLAGEQRVAAVLLAEGVVDMAIAETAITAHGGTFMQLLGTRAIGIFGAGAWKGDELERAAHAASEIRTIAEAVSVSLGHVRGGKGELLGDALRAAEDGCAQRTTGVVVEAKAARMLGRSFKLEPAEGGFFKLVRERRSSPMAPAPTVELRALRVGDSLPPERVPGMAPLVGRAIEVAQIKRGLETVLGDWKAVPMLVVGPAGIGKSRIHREMLRLLGSTEQPVRVLQGRAEPISGGALSLMADALRRRARMGAVQEDWKNIDAAAIEDRRAAVLRLAAEGIVDEAVRAESAPFLGELLGVDMGESEALVAARKDAQVMSDRLRVAVFDYFEGMAKQGPFALCLEDLHWADAGTLKIVEELAERLADQPFLFFATARPDLDDGRPEYLKGPELVRITPGALGPSDVAALARATAGRDIAAPLAKKIAERTGGNPLFVEQVVLELAERELLDAPPEALPLPVSVEAAIQSRLDHLPLVEKTTCKRAALLGRPFSAEELEGMGVADAPGRLESLRLRGIISARAIGQVGKGREYRFTHALVAEVAYNMLAPESKVELHQRAAVVLARAPVAEADDEEIASHHERGEQLPQAGARYTTAAITANRKGDGDKTVRCSDKALVLGAPDEHRFELHMARSETLQFLARYDDQAKDLDEAWERATTDAARARVLIDRFGNCWWTGKTLEATTVGEQSVAHAQMSSDSDLHARALFKHSLALMYGGKHEAARYALDATSALLHRCNLATRGFVESGRGTLAALTGDLGEMHRAFTASVASFTKAGDLRRAANNEGNLGESLNRLGGYGEAERVLRNAIEKASRVGHRGALEAARNNLAYTCITVGRVDDGLALLNGQIAADRRKAALGGKFRAAALSERGDLDEALGVAEEAARAFEALGEKVAKAETLAILARARLALGRFGGALEATLEAMTIRDAHGSVEVDEAQIFLVHAQALAAVGKQDESRRVLARGRTRLNEMARKITDPVWRKRFLEDVKANRELLARSEPQELAKGLR